METNNAVIEYKVKFSTNKGDFNEQPIFVLTPNKSLTGTDFISVCRLRKSSTDAVSGVLKLIVGTSSQVYSVTGTFPIYAQSMTASNYTSTASNTQYVISTIFNGKTVLNVVTNDGEGYHGDINLSNFSQLMDMKYLGTGIRPEGEANAATGIAGSSMVLLYLFNREELGTSLTAVADRTSNGLSATIRGSASGDGTTATVTGWTFGPSEGAFRLDKNSYINSVTSSLFNPNSYVASSMTVMLLVKLSKTGNSQIFTIGSGTTHTISLAEDAGILKFRSGTNTFTASTLDIGKWYHLAVTVDGRGGALCGSKIYVNGVSAAASAITGCPVLGNSRLILGRNLDLTTSGLTGSIGITTVHNRSLSAQEIMQNYLASIPSMVIIDSIKIA